MPLTDKLLKKIGQRIREARSAKKFSQEEVAERASLSATYVGRLERGEKQPSLETLIILADRLEVSPLDLLIDLEPRPAKPMIRSRIKKLVDLL